MKMLKNDEEGECHTYIYRHSKGQLSVAHGLPQGYMLPAEELRVVCTSVKFLTDSR